MARVGAAGATCVGAAVGVASGFLASATNVRTEARASDIPMSTRMSVPHPFGALLAPGILSGAGPHV